MRQDGIRAMVCRSIRCEKGMMMRRSIVVLLELTLLSVVYLAVASAMTWPMVSELDRQVVGGGEFGGWLWRIWWHYFF